MLLFKQYEMPDTCYIQEAAFWVVFGRAPEWFHYEDKGDARGIPEAFLESGEPESYDAVGYSALEFAMAGVEVDWARYQSAREGVSSTSAEAKADFEKNWARDFKFSERLSAEEKEQLQRELDVYLAERQREIAELEWAEGVEEAMVPIVDRAHAVIFQALTEGTLKAEGWVDFVDWEQDETAQYRPIEEVGAFETIPANVWSLRNFDWRKSTFKTIAKKYRLAQVKTADLLSVFPQPTCPSFTFEARAFGEVVMAIEDTKTEQTSLATRPRGRPPKGGLPIRDVVRNLFYDRIAADETPVKQESLVQDVMSFVKKAYKVDIGRTTAQDYIRPLKHQPRVPEIDAGKYAAN
ncbi:hypothetical protein [Mesorhizobium sp. M4B.F.Ca.ET.017.02.2.1]|uniref:hypothetical protein n=1 Tax=Mesorhizobium sp. M4B.F.Ca.ET.017.02.2.1 TaxID=2496649 RepID=UPI000FCA1D50|nr:hypothetical protein [Mesorhizobium sp. M4B.F.Ca.ET.017.02.2.1]RVD26597.1 hypothetical protein EN738_12985 [Mesorhizobium sp. M4B.F.Ca.ET.017.02.2.1]